MPHHGACFTLVSLAGRCSPSRFGPCLPVRGASPAATPACLSTGAPPPASLPPPAADGPSQQRAIAIGRLRAARAASPSSALLELKSAARSVLPRGLNQSISLANLFALLLQISSLNLLRTIAAEEGVPIEQLNAGRITDWSVSFFAFFFPFSLRRASPSSSSTPAASPTGPFFFFFPFSLLLVWLVTLPSCRKEGSRD